MSAPGKARTIQQVKVLPGERPATAPVWNSACREVTNCMTPGERRYQAATQVKGWSPEITIVVEADLLHFQGKQHCANR